MPIIGDDGSVVQRRHMIPRCCASEITAISPRVPSIRRFLLSFALFSFVSPLGSTTSSLFVKRVAIAPMPRDIADATLHTIPRRPRNARSLTASCALLFSLPNPPSLAIATSGVALPFCA